MKEKHAKKLIELYKTGHAIYYLADTDDYYGWVIADAIIEDKVMISFDIVNFVVPLLDGKYNINSFKVYKNVEDWWK